MIEYKRNITAHLIHHFLFTNEKKASESDLFKNIIKNTNKTQRKLKERNIKIKPEINEIETRKQEKRSIKLKTGSWEKPLARLIKKKRRWLKSIKLKMK